MKYTGKTVVELAHDRGANRNITKKETAWKYLLADLAKYNPPITLRGNRYERGAGEKASYLAKTWRDKIAKNGDILCHTHGYLMRHEIPGELQVSHIKYREALLGAIGKVRRYDISSLPRTPQDWCSPQYILHIGGRDILLSRTDSASWDNPQSHYPSSSSITRTASLLPMGWDDVSDTALISLNRTYFSSLKNLAEKSINYEARGNWVRKIIIELLNIPAAAKRGYMHIQLDAHYRISKIRQIGKVEIWSRTLAGDVIDYCAMRGKDTYHAAAPRAAVRGLAAKLAVPGSRREILDMDFALSLGFCKTGVEQFCDDLNLNPELAYSRGELQSIVFGSNKEIFNKYVSELSKAGIICK